MKSTTYILLLRGVNVGGHHKVSMNDLRAMLEGLGCENVKTYIQSGNAVFVSTKSKPVLRRMICETFEARFGFEATIFLLDTKALRATLEGSLFRGEAHHGSRSVVSFLARKPTAAQVKTLESLDFDEDDRCHVEGDVLYVWCPNGLSQSKLLAEAHKLVGKDSTTRNRRTIETLLTMAQA